MSKPSTDVVRRVFPEEGMYFLEVGPWADDPGLVELRTMPGKFSAEYFGVINLSMTQAMARELGRALIAAADDIARDVGAA